MIMSDFWLDYNVCPCDKIQSIISSLCYYYEISVSFNTLLEEESLCYSFPSDFNVTDSVTTNRKCFRVQLETYTSNL